ncbi:MAG: ABC transporter permease [Thermoplasmatales archaeon]|jgi:peptide/nickel transport system permease protein
MALSTTWAFLKRMMRNPYSAIGTVIMILFFGWAIIEGILRYLGPALGFSNAGYLLLPYNPFSFNLSQSLVSPSLSHLFGTDSLGRDLFSRVLYSIPIDAAISVIVVGGGIVIGGVVGLTAGYYGKGVDQVNMRVTDLFLAFPALVLAMVIEYTIGRSILYATISLIVVWWPVYARLFRSEALRIKNMRFVDSAILSGLSRMQVIRRHFVRPALNTIMSYATVDLGNVILTYSILSFLGLGIPPPEPELGSMVSDGLSYFPQNWWWAILPGVVIVLIVVGAALFGDGVRDYLAGE